MFVFCHYGREICLKVIATAKEPLGGAGGTASCRR